MYGYNPIHSLTRAGKKKAVPPGGTETLTRTKLKTVRIQTILRPGRYPILVFKVRIKNCNIRICQNIAIHNNLCNLSAEKCSR